MKIEFEYVEHSLIIVPYSSAVKQIESDIILEPLSPLVGL